MSSQFQVLIFILIGLTAGVGSGLFGIGGGIIIIPMLMYLIGLPQKAASATSLVALILPVGILGVWSYYKAGVITNEHLRMGALVSAGIFFGTFFGSKLAIMLPTRAITKAFALFLIFVAAKLWFQNPKS